LDATVYCNIAIDAFRRTLLAGVAVILANPNGDGLYANDDGINGPFVGVDVADDIDGSRGRCVRDNVREAFSPSALRNHCSKHFFASL
jgi:hypothetical protein